MVRSLMDVSLIMAGFAVAAAFFGVVAAICARSMHSKFNLLATFFAITFFAGAAFLSLNAIIIYLAGINLAFIAIFWIVFSALLSIIVGVLFVHKLSSGDKKIVSPLSPKELGEIKGPINGLSE
jgi:hypothetical protein